MEGDFIKTNKWLLPLSWIYGLGVGFRNMLFEVGALKSRSFDIPIISVGNITVGGTGKTPHTEYLVELLESSFKVAVLSRGYKRKSRGFRLAADDSTVSDVGDEPLQMHRKYGSVAVAVDKNRCHGIDTLVGNDGKLDVIILDDAFQHRYVKPGVNILLVDYHRLIIYDTLLPAGRLREPLAGKNRADIVIVTKCPGDLKPMEFRVITKAMNLYPYQKLFFTTLKYEFLRSVFGEGERSLDNIAADEHVLLLTGIASPQQMEEDLKRYATDITPLAFADHHKFTKGDISLINDTFAEMPSPKIIITTEKDAMRLRDVDGLDDNVRQALYVLPVKVDFMLDQNEAFDDTIVGYVRKNSKNSQMSAKAYERSRSKKKSSTTISFAANKGDYN